jgi:addiction module HigA family antidote
MTSSLQAVLVSLTLAKIRKAPIMGQLRNPHPGEILKEEFLKEIGKNQLAQAIGVPGNRVHAIVKGTRDITADTDLRLCKFFGLTDGYFLRLQNAYDMLEARRKIAREVTRIKRYKSDKAA